MSNKIGDILAYRIEVLCEQHKERTKQQEGLLTQYMNVARIALLAE